MSISAVGAYSSSQVQQSNGLDPNVIQALEDIDGLNEDIASLMSLLESGKGTPQQIAALQQKIAADSSQLDGFMSSHASSFTSEELSIAKGLDAEAGNLAMLPPQDAIDISHVAGFIQAYSSILHAMLFPTK